jgi:hypothetical protein
MDHKRVRVTACGVRILIILLGLLKVIVLVV